MAQGDVALLLPPNPMANLLRRRLGMAQSKPEDRQIATPTRRCLFGGPDLKQAEAKAKSVEERSQWAFSKRWNFNITGQEAPIVLEPSNAENVPLKYEWVQVYPTESSEEEPRPFPTAVMRGQESRVPLIRMDATISTATTVENVEEQATTTPETSGNCGSSVPLLEKKDLNATSDEVLKTPPNTPKRPSLLKCHSPTSNIKCLRVRNGSPSRSHSPTKVMRQRAITDYVQVKKALLYSTSCGSCQ